MAAPRTLVSRVLGASFAFTLLATPHASAEEKPGTWETGNERSAPENSTPAATAPRAPATSPSPSEPPAAAPGEAPPPGYPPPPPPGYPPYGYPPPPGYYVPGHPPPDDRPRYLPYREGEPTPPGYYYEERARRGPIITGAILIAVPYGLGLSIAAGAQFENQSGWLAVPVLGPWLTLALRDKCYGEDAFDCTGDAGVRTVLVLDALMQTTGAALLIWGLNSKSQRYVRNDVALKLSPMSVGQRGYGFGAVGTF